MPLMDFVIADGNSSDAAPPATSPAVPPTIPSVELAIVSFIGGVAKVGGDRPRSNCNAGWAPLEPAGPLSAPDSFQKSSSSLAVINASSVLSENERKQATCENP